MKFRLFTCASIACALAFSASSYGQDPVPPPDILCDKVLDLTGQGLTTNQAVAAYLDVALVCADEIVKLVQNDKKWVPEKLKFLERATERALKVYDQTMDVQEMLLIDDQPEGLLFGQITVARSLLKVVRVYIDGSYLGDFSGELKQLVGEVDCLYEIAAAIIRGEEICDNGFDDNDNGLLDDEEPCFSCPSA